MKALKKPLLMALWFVFLTFPLMVIKVDTNRNVVTWRWWNMLWVALATLVLYPLWRYLLARKEGKVPPLRELFLDRPWVFMLIVAVLCITGLIVPLGLMQMLGMEILARKRVVSATDTEAKDRLKRTLLKPVIPFLIFGAAFVIAEAMGDLVHNFLLLSVIGCIAVYVALPMLMKMLRPAQDTPAEPKPLFQDPKTALPAILTVVFFTMTYPFLYSLYQVKIMVLALTYVVLGLGLNIVVGIAGLLDLGYVAFYAVGAYTYALLYYYFDISFWVALPLGGILAAIFGVLLGIPVLRLRGDYLAIVTLGFGEIIRLVLENWGSFTQGPSGIKNIPPPVDPTPGGFIDSTFSFFGFESKMQQTAVIIYFIMLLMVVVTIFAVNRLQNSRIGRAWLALREDEIACQAMGIDKTRTKLTAFALGATWAGFAGVLFAARERFVNPMSFQFIESAMILSVVVLGGMGSIVGVILGALILILVPEYLRVFADYRMLLFGATMVLIMVFRPQGLVSNVRRHYRYKKQSEEAAQ